MAKRDYIRLEKFLKEDVDNKKFSALFGNGLEISFNEISERKNDLSSKKKIVADIIIKKFKKLVKDYLKNKEEKKRIRSLGHLVESFHIRVLYFVSELYIDEAAKKYYKADEFHKLIKKFESLFTISLDPIVYHNIFNNEDSGDISDFKDGFSGSVPLKADEIMKRMSGAIPFYYLHGAFHILHSLDLGKYKKIVRSKNDGKKLYQKVKEEFVKMLEANSVDSSNFESSALISSNHHKKGMFCKIDDYKRKCFDKLKEVENLFVFGCSFHDDHHILKVLGESTRLKNLYICFKGKESNHDLDVRVNIKKALKEIGHELLLDKVIWVKSDSFGKMFWKD